MASPGEIDAVLDAGGRPEDLSYGNTIKKVRDIAYAAHRGMGLFTVDSAGELEKVTTDAPGSTVLVRVATTGAGADWALGGKFGCSGAEAGPAERGPTAGHRVGVAFHVGSQQRDPGAWDAPLAAGCRAARRSAAATARTWPSSDIGGGFPAHC